MPTGKPLDGLVVLDFTHAAAGPMCSMLLADFGAKVIKVEKPGRGDHARHMTMLGMKDYVTGADYYLSLNRNKQSVAIDLATDEGRKLALELAKRPEFQGKRIVTVACSFAERYISSALFDGIG